MERCNKIISNPDYQGYLQQTGALEAKRIYCRHNFEHLLTVARLTYILLLENGFPYISREIAYGAGLLHDIGRWQEYTEGKDHAEGSAEMADPILKEAGFTLSERSLIIKAISQHRKKLDQKMHRSPLSKALSKADNLSRLCFLCTASNNCNKPDRQAHKGRLVY